MVAASMRALWLLAALALFAGCPSKSTPDAGSDAGVDAAVPPPGCSNGADCVAKGWDVCRSGLCATAVACADDVECGLGESCVNGACAFTGCVKDADCPTGKCRANVFECVECGANTDCPSNRPVCDLSSNACVQCGSDADCQPPGPGYCDTTSGACVHCLVDDNCPNGLKCTTQHVCQGVPLGGTCPMGTTCDVGLTCVQLSGTQQCQQACSLYHPDCTTGNICYKLTFSATNSLVFDTDGPLGVCYTKPSGYKDYRQACTRSGSMSNCQPNLVCVPEDANLSLCRTFCDPNDPNACPSGEKCHTFPGDAEGHRYGLCYPDNGWGDPCTGDATCRAGQVCGPYDDPSASGSLSPVCQYDVGDGGAMAPCAAVNLPDGGMITADSTCASGACVGDSFGAPSFKYYCYAACATDQDCSVNGHTGYCDGTFSFLTSTGTTGTLPGCRVACGSDLDCAQYQTGNTCRPRFLTGYNAALSQACNPVAGALPAGAACVASASCASGFCITTDGRGVSRDGYCGTPCANAAQCVNDAGFVSVTGTLACQTTELLGWSGWDGVPGTADDKLVASRFCAGQPCVTDTDCGGTGVCAPDVDPADAGNSLVLHCLPFAGVAQGGTPCTTDSQCLSGVCGQLQPPSTGSGKACFEACDGTTTCPGSTVCRAKGMRVSTLFTSVDLDSCAP